MMICSLCSHCGAEHDLSDKSVGTSIACRECRQTFVVVAVTDRPAEPDTLEVESVFQSDRAESPGHARAPSQASKAAVKDGRHVLVIPPPPCEQWSNEDSEAEGDEPFRLFDPDSRAVERFVERDDRSDHGWLLISGLVAMIAVLVVFQVLLILVLFW